VPILSDALYRSGPRVADAAALFADAIHPRGASAR
jgi:hypothetical protein